VGLLRNVIIGDTDGEAQRIAERVWRAFAANFNWLVNWLGIEPFPIPAEFAGAEAMGMAFAGSPESACAWIDRMRAEAGVNYLAAELVFGDMTSAEAERSVTLFGTEVMPAFA
jgi:alkanesulfonate monooxygenase SsuD/methylene tetrahydromethanopterin reductase-like flavin-dependent oxidoreductase (luciferase family)